MVDLDGVQVTADKGDDEGDDDEEEEEEEEERKEWDVTEVHQLHASRGRMGNRGAWIQGFFLFQFFDTTRVCLACVTHSIMGELLAWFG